MTNPDQGHDRRSAPGIPRWLKLSGLIIAVLVVVAVAIMVLAGGDNGGGHGPSRH